MTGHPCLGPSALGLGQRMEMPEPKPVPVAVPELQVDRRTGGQADRQKGHGEAQGQAMVM